MKSFSALRLRSYLQHLLPRNSLQPAGIPLWEGTMPTPLLLRLYHEIHYKRKFSACQGGFHKVHIFFFLFHRLQRFHHVDFFHFEMHEDIHHRRESSRDQCAIEKTYRMYLSAEHYRVHLHGNDHEPVEQNAEPASEQDPAYGEQDIFPEYVFRDLQVIKSQDLQRGKLSLSLCDVDIVQIIEDHECQHSRRDDQDNDHHVL